MWSILDCRHPKTRIMGQGLIPGDQEDLMSLTALTSDLGVAAGGARAGVLGILVCAMRTEALGQVGIRTHVHVHQEKYVKCVQTSADVPSLCLHLSFFPLATWQPPLLGSAQSPGFGAPLPGLNSPLCVMGNLLGFLCLRYPMCKMEVIIASIS